MINKTTAFPVLCLSTLLFASSVSAAESCAVEPLNEEIKTASRLADASWKNHALYFPA